MAQRSDIKPPDHRVWLQRLWLIALITLLPLVAAARELVTYTVQHADPAQLSQVIGAYLSPGSSVSAYQNQLIVNATPAELTRVRTLLDQLDVGGRQLRISVKTRAAGHSGGQDNSVSGSVRIERHSGVEVHSRVTVREYQSRQEEGSRQGVRATEGQPAYISTGSSAPINTYRHTADGRSIRSQEYVSAATGFYATAWVTDGAVRVVIEQQREQWQGSTIDSQQLQTQVNGRLGEWIPIGVVSGSSRQENRATGRHQAESGSSAQTIYLKVELLDS